MKHKQNVGQTNHEFQYFFGNELTLISQLIV